MQKPTLCIYVYARAQIKYTRVYNTPMSIYCYLFSSFKFEVSQVPNGQKQALVNAIKLCLRPHPVTSKQTPQREFASAKVQQKNDIRK